MISLQELLEEALNPSLTLFSISKPVRKDGARRIRIRPMMLGGQLVFQAASYTDTQVFHSNLPHDEAVRFVLERIPSSFLQAQIECAGLSATVLANKKGTLTIKAKRLRPDRSSLSSESGRAAASPDPDDASTGRIPSSVSSPPCVSPADPRPSATSKTPKIEAPARPPATSKAPRIEAPARISLEHNRPKQYLLPEGEPVPFLVKLGVMTQDGRVVKARYDKYRQINRFLEFVRDILPELESKDPIEILDFGCGRSYLTFAIYYYLHEICGLGVRITGLDLKEDVIRDCQALAEECRYMDLRFLCGDIAGYQDCTHVDLVVTLHACDTATDYALAKAVGWGAKVILSVPCCQHELARQIDSSLLAPVLSYGILKERMSALLTDGLRARLLEEQGYQVQLLEFIDMAHTPKNLLIRAVRSHRGGGRRADVEALLDSLHADLTLDRLLSDPSVRDREMLPSTFP